MNPLLYAIVGCGRSPLARHEAANKAGAGMTEKLIAQLLKMRAPKVVYVSCNPATQARDMLILKEKYDTIKIQPVDMFPHTQHVENVMLLRLRK